MWKAVKSVKEAYLFIFNRRYTLGSGTFNQLGILQISTIFKLSESEIFFPKKLLKIIEINKGKNGLL